MTTKQDRDTMPAPWFGDAGCGVTRRRLLRLTVGGATGFALAARGAGWERWEARAQTATPEPEADPVADPEAGPSEPATPRADGTPRGAAGNLVVYSGRNENLVGPLMARFEPATGIAVEVRYAGTPELAATILEEGEASPADVFFAQDAGSLGLLAQEGRFRRLPEEILARVEPRFRSPDGLWVGTSGRARVLAYNTDALRPGDLPASVMDLTDPKWKGKIGWAPENASFQAFVTALRILEGDDAARQWLEGMLANEPVGFGDSNVALVTAVGRGEVQAGLTNHYYLYALKRQEGEAFPVANHFFAPGDPGSLVNVAGVGVLTSAANADQAMRFVDFLLSREAQTYFAEETSEYPLIAGVPTAAGLKPLAEVGSPEIDLSDLADLRGTLDLLAEVGLL